MVNYNKFGYSFLPWFWHRRDYSFAFIALVKMGNLWITE